MSKNIFYFLAGLAFALNASPSHAAGTATTVATVPDGMMTLSIKHGVTNYLSLPLTKTSIYSGTVASVTTTTITVDDNPAPFPQSVSIATPYFVKFLDGKEAGRVMLVTSNTTSSLTVDTTDHISGDAVALTSTGFDVQAGDAFEVFPGDTLATVLGNSTSSHPLVVTGGANSVVADTVSLYTASNAPAATFFFNTTAGFWQKSGSNVSANNTIIYPYSVFTVVRRAAHPDTTLTLSGRVTQVQATTKLVSRGTVYTSNHFATDIKLSQLQFGSNWLQGTTIMTADTLSIWNAALSKFEVFYQKPDATWRKYPDATTDQSNFVISAGGVATIAKRAVVSGAQTFLRTGLPYTLR